MKTIRITLIKEGEMAVCTNNYYFTESTRSSVWTGNRKAFALINGSLPNLSCPLDQLHEVAAFQAAQSGASFTIEDLGGEAMMWTDEVLGSGNIGSNDDTSS
ncbi:MAG: hypothetical protein WCO57_14935 [Verrucomicrobiota bacterium]